MTEKRNFDKIESCLEQLNVFFSDENCYKEYLYLDLNKKLCINENNRVHILDEVQNKVLETLIKKLFILGKEQSLHFDEDLFLVKNIIEKSSKDDADNLFLSEKELVNKRENFENKKTRWRLLDLNTLKPVAKILENDKIIRDASANFDKINDSSVFLDSAIEHLVKYENGEEKDEDCVESHLAYCICNLTFLLKDRRNKAEIPFSEYIKDLINSPK